MITRRKVLFALSALVALPVIHLRNAQAAVCKPLASWLDLSPCGCKERFTAADRELIVRQAMLLFDHIYVHLPQKRQRHQVRRQLKRLLGAARDPRVDDEKFDRDLIAVLNRMRDKHLIYVRPMCFSGCSASLPFRVAEITENNACKYIVFEVESKRIEQELGSVPSGFGNGTEIKIWNGLPIDRVVARHAKREPAAHEHARRAMAVETLTLRPLRGEPAPSEECVVIRYIDANGTLLAAKFTWRVKQENFEQQALPQALSKPFMKAPSPVQQDADLDMRLHELQLMRAVLFPEQPPVSGVCVDSKDGNLTFRPIGPEAGALGYIRIRRFRVGNAHDDVFVDAFKAFLTNDAKVENLKGLIIDIRDNPGGKIRAAERVLQMLTPNRPIQPALFQFRNTEHTLNICRADDAGELKRFAPLIKAGMDRHEAYSAALPMTLCDECNGMQPLYKGPVVLITSALTYSAAEFFAAAFDDHDMGWILGVDAATGGGGANSKSLVNLWELQPEGEPFKHLSGDADFKVALRRSYRVGRNAHKLLEGNGVTPHKVHKRTRNDVLNCDADLFAEALKLLDKTFVPPSPVRPTQCTDA